MRRNERAIFLGKMAEHGATRGQAQRFLAQHGGSYARANRHVAAVERHNRCVPVRQIATGVGIGAALWWLS